MGQSLEKQPSSHNLQREKIWTKGFTLTVISNFFIFLGLQMTLPTIPLFVKQLGGNDQLVGIVVSLFTFSALIFRPVAGKNLEVKGRGFVYTSGLGLFVVSVCGFGMIHSPVFLFLFRIMQGIGWGFSSTASGTIATDFIPPNRRGEGMGYFGLSGNLAMAFGPSLGLTLAGIISFPRLFFTCAVLGFISFVFACIIPYKKIEAVPVQRRKWDLFEKSALSPSFLLFFITLTFGGIAAFLPIYTGEKNIGGIHYYFLVYAIALMISRSFSGRIYDRKGHQAVFIPGAALILMAMSLLVWLPNQFALLSAGCLYGFGFGMVQPALQAWAVKEAPAHRKGMANATFFSFFDLGIGIGAITFGQVAHFFGYSSIYLVAAFSVFISILLYGMILKKNKLPLFPK